MTCIIEKKIHYVFQSGEPATWWNFNIASGFKIVSWPKSSVTLNFIEILSCFNIIDIYHMARHILKAHFKTFKMTCIIKNKIQDVFQSGEPAMWWIFNIASGFKIASWSKSSVTSNVIQISILFWHYWDKSHDKTFIKGHFKTFKMTCIIKNKIQDVFQSGEWTMWWIFNIASGFKIASWSKKFGDLKCHSNFHPSFHQKQDQKMMRWKSEAFPIKLYPQ